MYITLEQVIDESEKLVIEYSGKSQSTIKIVRKTSLNVLGHWIKF